MRRPVHDEVSSDGPEERKRRSPGRLYAPPQEPEMQDDRQGKKTILLF